MKFDKQQLERLTALYSTGQLSEVERKQLLAAALEDQELFDTLAHEDTVRDALILPGARERVLEELRPKRSRWFAWAGGLAVAAATAVIFMVVRTQPVTVKAPPLIAENKVDHSVAVKEKEAAPMVADINQPARVTSAPKIQEAPKVVALSPPAREAHPTSPPPPSVPMEIAKESAVLQEKTDGTARTDLRAVASNAPAVAAGVRAAEQPRVNFQAAMPAAKKASAPAAYTILRRDGEGIFVPVPSGEMLKFGDSVRISIKAPLSGRMIVDSGSSSFQETKAGEIYVIPTTGEIVLNKPAGESLVRVSFMPSDLAVEGRAVSTRFRDASTPAASAPANSVSMPVALEIKLTYK